MQKQRQLSICSRLFFLSASLGRMTKGDVLEGAAVDFMNAMFVSSAQQKGSPRR